MAFGRVALAADTTPPTIDEVKAAAQGDQLVVSAHIVDESGVFAPTLYYRKRSHGHFDSVSMTLHGGRYQASVPLHDRVDYWIEAYDIFGNGPTRSGGPKAPRRWTRRKAAREAKTRLEEDKTPPTLQFTPPQGAHPGATVTFAATAEDPSGLFGPTLYWRKAGAKKYEAIEMSQSGDRISASLKVTGDVEYFIDVYDTAGNGPAHAGSESKPLRLPVEAARPAITRTEPVVKPVAVKKPAAVAKSAVVTTPATSTEIEPPGLWARIETSVLPNRSNRKAWVIAGGAVGTAAVVAGVVAIVLAGQRNQSYGSTWLVIQHGHL